MPISIVAVADQVHDDGSGEDEDIILAIGDFYPVSVRPAEPALGNRCRDVISTSDRVLVVEKIPLGFEVIGPGDIDSEPMVDEGEQLALDHRQLLVSAPQLVRWSPVEKLLLDVNELVAGHVLKRQLVPEAQRLAIDEEGVRATFVLDCEVVAPGQELLFHHVSLQVFLPMSSSREGREDVPVIGVRPSEGPENTRSTVQLPLYTPSPSCA
jgi:hypothetical protein